MTDEQMSQLKQAVDLAQHQVQDLNRYADSARDDCHDCADAYADGIEAGLEPFEDFIDDIQKILKQHDIETVQNTKHIPSDKQMMLNL